MRYLAAKGALPMIGFSIAASALVSLASTSAKAQTIAQWTFDNLAIANNNAPGASTGAGSAFALGMTNNYTYTQASPNVGSVNTDDILAQTGSSNAAASNQTWRVRGSSPGNGWNLSAPQYTQGVEFDASTVGFKTVVFTYDWFSTNQGVRDLQEQYNLNVGNSAGWTNIGSLQVAQPNAFQNGLTIDLTNVTGTSNDANFGIRLVSAYDPTYPGTGAPSYTSATLTGGQPTQYNNNSGNWRFDTVTYSGSTVTGAASAPEPTSLSLVLMGMVSLGFNELRRRRTP